MGACLVMAGLSACSPDRDKATSVRVQPGQAVSLSAGSVRVELPAGAADGGAELRLDPSAEPPKLLSATGVERVGDPILVELRGSTLHGPATVTLPVPNGHRDDPALVVVWQDGSGGWRALPTRRRPGQPTAVAQTDHFSWGFLARIDVSDWARRAKGDVLNYVTGRAGVAQRVNLQSESFVSARDGHDQPHDGPPAEGDEHQ